MTEKLSQPLDDFKPRELEIINMMAEGLSNQEIADSLFITTGTVRWYNKQIYSKLGTSRRTEAVALAREMGLLQDDAPDEEKTVRHHLPVTTGPFLGRDTEISELSALLNKPEVRLLSIIAAGGMGKSHLSLELAHLIKGNYEQGAAFIDLTAVRNPDDIGKAILTNLGLSISDHQSVYDVVLNYCREKELLLIFDNFEHVLAGASLLTDILDIAPKVKIIATSRERLNLRAETVFYLQPVTQDADALFIEVATIMRPNINLNEDDLADVKHIVELVGGLPLGLVLAATWVDTLSIREIAEEIQASLEFLSVEMGDVPDRQQSIHAVIDPTWKRLNESEQKDFMWASVFRGGFTRETFQQVTGASIRTLQTLLNRSLITHGYGRRYDMHPLIYQYAREKLNQFEMLAEAKNKHLQVMRQYAEHHAQRMFEGHYLQSLDALEHETDNVRAALDWSLQGHHIEDGIALILANSEFWQTRSRAIEGIYYVEQAMQHMTHPRLYYWESVFSDRLGDYQRSIDAAQRLIDYSEANQDDELLAYGQLRLGIKQSRAKAQALFESALANAKKTENQSLIAMCLSYLALSEPKQSNTTPSLIHDALEIYESLGDLHGISRVTNNLAIYYYDNLEYGVDAKSLMETSLRLKREIGDRAGEARRLTTLSLWAIEEEEFEQAENWLIESREICEELGELDRLSYVLGTEGLLHFIKTDFVQAQMTFERSLDMNIRIDDKLGAVDMYALLSYVHLMQNNLTQAKRFIHQSIELAEQTTQQYALLMITYANYLWQQRDVSAAVPILAFLAIRDLNIYSGSNAIIDKYLLQPLIYRVQQHIGDDAWQDAITKAKEMPTEEVFGTIMEHSTQPRDD